MRNKVIVDRLKCYRFKVTRKMILILIITIISLYLLYGLLNNPLTLTSYTIESSELPIEFNNYKIIQISDFHCKYYKDNESKLIDMIVSADPNLIVITGDTIDGEHSSLSNVNILLQGIYKLCPILAINGNHETDNHDTFQKLNNLYSDFEVIVINDKTYTVNKENSSIIIQGIDYSTISWRWGCFNAPKDKYSILLFHDSSEFELTSTIGYDLILSGHAHGGVIRLPFLGGIISTDKTFGARYEHGMYKKNNSTMIASSGLGDAKLPRFNNPPEVVEIILKSQ